MGCFEGPSKDNSDSFFWVLGSHPILAVWTLHKHISHWGSSSLNFKAISHCQSITKDPPFHQFLMARGVNLQFHCLIFRNIYPHAYNYIYSIPPQNLHQFTILYTILSQMTLHNLLHYYNNDPNRNRCVGGVQRHYRVACYARPPSHWIFDLLLAEPQRRNRNHSRSLRCSSIHVQSDL